MKCRPGKTTGNRPAFTFIELLAVISIISILTGLLLPAINRARSEAYLVSCMSRERQLADALIAYAATNRGRFPPNTPYPSPGSYWNDVELLGIQSDTAYPTDPGVVVGTIFTCPADRTSVRNYAMNFWASSGVYIANPTIRATIARRGIFWNYTVKRPSQMLLLSETWSSILVQNGVYRCSNYIGYAGDDPAGRFGANGGISPLLSEGPWGSANSEIAYILHRAPSTNGLTTAWGRVNMAFADGHVATESATDLFDSSGHISSVAYWSPLDFQGQ